MSNDFNSKLEQSINDAVEMILMEARYRISNRLSINALEEQPGMLCEESAPNTDCGSECSTCHNNNCTSQFSVDAIDEAMEQMRKKEATMPNAAYHTQDIRIAVKCIDCQAYAKAMHQDPCNNCHDHSKWIPTTAVAKQAIDDILSNWPSERYEKLRSSLCMAVTLLKRAEKIFI